MLLIHHYNTQGSNLYDIWGCLNPIFTGAQLQVPLDFMLTSQRKKNEILKASKQGRLGDLHNSVTL